MKKLLRELESSILQRMLKDVNKMLGQKQSASFLSTSLMLKLRPMFVLRQSDEVKVHKTLNIEDLDDVFNSIVVFDEPDVVVFELYYKNKKSIKRLIKLAIKHAEYFAFHYIKALVGSVEQVHTKAFIQSNLKLVGGKANAFEVVANGVDIYLNTRAMEVLDATDGYNTILLKTVVPIHQLTDTPLDIKEVILAIGNKYETMSVTKIPKRIRKTKLKALSHIDEELVAISNHNQEEGKFGYLKGATKESVVVDLSITLDSILSSSCKGTGVGDLLAQSFTSVKVDAIWFENLSKSLASMIIEKSNEGYSSWGSVNAKKRHLYTSPIRVSEDKKLSLVVSIDVSGSISTADLQKILGIFEEYSETIRRVTIMQHTSAVIQEATIDDPSDIQGNEDFQRMLGQRHGNGGTSHLDVFKRTQKLFDKNPELLPEDTIFLSFSDNYSDIEDTFYKYPIMDKLDCYWVRDTHGRDVNIRLIGGTNIVTP